MNQNHEKVFKIGAMLLEKNMINEFKELCSELGISKWSVDGKLIFKDGNMNAL